MSLDGVVEAPNTYVRPDLFEDFPTLFVAGLLDEMRFILCPRCRGERSPSAHGA
jgi:hypothetical protein